MDRNRDRGQIKWTSLMLPEHLDVLRQWQREDRYVERPELTEWELQEMQGTLEHAVKRRCETFLKTWHDGEIRFHQGVIEMISLQTGTIILQDPFGAETIRVEDIIDVQFAKNVEGI